MNNEYVTEIRSKVAEILKDKPDRFWHSVGVANTAAALAMRYNVDMQKAYIAGLVHDCAKYLSDQDLLMECKKHGIEISEYEEKSPYLLHGKVGALYSKEKFGIDDDEILSAVTYHTTGKPDMTTLEEIIFIADFLEPMRNKAFDLDEVRSLVFIDLKKTVYIVLRDTLTYLEKSSKPIDKLTYDTYTAYKNKLEEV